MWHDGCICLLLTSTNGNRCRLQLTGCFFQSESYRYMEQIGTRCRGGFLRQLLQETTGRLQPGCGSDVYIHYYTLHVTDTAKWRRWVAGAQRRARLSWRCPLLHAAATARCETCSQVQSASDNTSSNSMRSQCFDAVGWVRQEGHPACKKSCTSHPFPDVLLLDLRGERDQA